MSGETRDILLQALELVNMHKVKKANEILNYMTSARCHKYDVVRTRTHTTQYSGFCFTV